MGLRAEFVRWRSVSGKVSVGFGNEERIEKRFRRSAGVGGYKSFRLTFSMEK